MEMNRLMTAPALSDCIRPTAVRPRSPTSIVLTRWISAVTELFEPSTVTGTSPGEPGLGSRSSTSTVMARLLPAL